jgi:glycosyltransferase involved in cell wall biosynthesis
MRLGFHYHIPAVNKDGRIYTMGLLGRFIDSLATYCESVVCFQHTPLPDELPLMDYAIRAGNVSFVNIGLHDSIPKRFLRFSRTRKLLAQHKHLIDVMLIRGPSPLLPRIARVFSGIPLVFLIVGDYTLGIDDMPMPKWRRELIRLWSILNKRQQTKLAKKNLTIVNSRKAFQEFQSVLPNLLETRTTTLNETDFYLRNDTCIHMPYRLLYSGRMDRAKGLFDMVEAVALLVDAGIDVVLDLVGWASRGDHVMKEVSNLAEKRGVKDRIYAHGYKSVGEELFSYYKKADIYWIASRGSEGFPRTIWEAMAHSLPVIATQVGSIPYFIDNHAILVKPSKPQELAEAVTRLIETPALRKKMIIAGRELAKKTTLEFQTSKLFDGIRGWVHSRETKKEQ